MTDADISKLAWRKSSYSGGGNDCVEVAFTPDGVAVRDSKNPAAGALALATAHWDTLLVVGSKRRTQPALTSSCNNTDDGDETTLPMNETHTLPQLIPPNGAATLVAARLRHGVVLPSGPPRELRNRLVTEAAMAIMAHTG